MTAHQVVLDIARIEAAHLAELVTQFAELVDDSGDGDPRSDPAIARLVPDAYRGDAEAADEFRSLTESELLDRRAADAAVVLATVHDAATIPPDAGDRVLTETVTITLDAEQTQAWLRTLAALRLVLAERLGIAAEDDHDEADPRFGIYDWLGFRLHGLVTALDDGD